MINIYIWQLCGCGEKKKESEARWEGAISKVVVGRAWQSRVCASPLSRMPCTLKKAGAPTERLSLCYKNRKITLSLQTRAPCSSQHYRKQSLVAFASLSASGGTKQGFVESWFQSYCQFCGRARRFKSLKCWFESFQRFAKSYNL
jgi:hypothetical protein